jgi:hypothetical protein
MDVAPDQTASLAHAGWQNCYVRATLPEDRRGGNILVRVELSRPGAAIATARLDRELFELKQECVVQQGRNEKEKCQNLFGYGPHHRDVSGQDANDPAFIFDVVAGSDKIKVTAETFGELRLGIDALDPGQ